MKWAGLEPPFPRAGDTQLFFMFIMLIPYNHCSNLFWGEALYNWAENGVVVEILP
jgi:hypothetical protein